VCFSRNNFKGQIRNIYFSIVKKNVETKLVTVLIEFNKLLKCYNEHTLCLCNALPIHWLYVLTGEKENVYGHFPGKISPLCCTFIIKDGT
jgi:hypothetical protein